MQHNKYGIRKEFLVLSYIIAHHYSCEQVDNISTWLCLTGVKWYPTNSNHCISSHHQSFVPSLTRHAAAVNLNEIPSAH